MEFMESKIELDIEFTTLNPLSQELGLKLWELGSHFHSVPGKGGRTYRLQSSGTVTGPGGTGLADAARELAQAIENVVKTDRQRQSGIFVRGISAKTV